MLTIGITSFNRLKYTKVLLRSIECLKQQAPGEFHVVVVDNGSLEPEVVDLVRFNLSGVVDDLFARPAHNHNWINDEYIAKNELIARSKGDIVLLLQDDCQLICSAQVLLAHAQDLREMPDVIAIDVAAVRKSTAQVAMRGVTARLHNGRRYWPAKDNHLGTTGFFKKSLFDALGPYPVDWPIDPSYWGRSEDHYDRLAKQNNAGLVVKSHVPLQIPVWNDPRGGYAFIRGHARHGHYWDPKSGDLYYEQLSDETFTELQKQETMASFIDVARPIGWTLPIADGDVIKYPQSKIVEHGPQEELFS